jgi:hypothetical protein
MTPERWERLNQLFHTLREHPPGERAAYLRDSCADDPSLQCEVERLLRAHEKATASANGGAASSLALRVGASLIVAGVVVVRIEIHTVFLLLWMPDSC